jgi:DnaJ family protein B protein 4
MHSCSLYSGTTKKMKITRKLATGETEPKVLEMSVRPGWKAGTKLKFKAAGNGKC